MTDFRALCVELTELVTQLTKHCYQPAGLLIRAADLRIRARAALADEPAVPEGREPAAVTGQPSDEELEGPTDEDIMGLMPQQMHDDLAAAARGMAAMALGADNTRVRGAMRITLNRHAVDLARAVLARWGSPVPAPQADVSQRFWPRVARPGNSR